MISARAGVVMLISLFLGSMSFPIHAPQYSGNITKKTNMTILKRVMHQSDSNLTDYKKLKTETSLQKNSTDAVCNVSLDHESAVAARKKFEKTFSHSESASSVMIIQLVSPQLKGRFSPKEQNQLLFWQWVKQEHLYVLEYPVDIDVITLYLIRIKYSEVTLNIDNVANCSFKFLENSIEKLLWNDIFLSNITKSYLCNRETSVFDVWKQVVFYTTSIWVGYDFSCSYSLDHMREVEKKKNGPVHITIICAIFSLFYPLIFKIIETKNIKKQLRISRKTYRSAVKDESDETVPKSVVIEQSSYQESRSKSKNADKCLTDEKKENIMMSKDYIYEKGDCPNWIQTSKFHFFFWVHRNDMRLQKRQNIAAIRLSGCFFLFLLSILIIRVCLLYKQTGFDDYQEIYIPISSKMWLNVYHALQGLGILGTLIFLPLYYYLVCADDNMTTKENNQDNIIHLTDIMIRRVLNLFSGCFEKISDGIYENIDYLLTLSANNYVECLFAIPSIPFYIVSIPVYVLVYFALTVVTSLCPLICMIICASDSIMQGSKRRKNEFRVVLCCSIQYILLLLSLPVHLVIVCNVTYVLRLFAYTVFVGLTIDPHHLRWLVVICTTLVYSASFINNFLQERKIILNAILDEKKEKHISETEFNYILRQIPAFRNKIYWLFVKLTVTICFCVITALVLLKNNNFYDTKADYLIKISFIALSPKVLFDFMGSNNESDECIKEFIKEEILNEAQRSLKQDKEYSECCQKVFLKRIYCCVDCFFCCLESPFVISNNNDDGDCACCQMKRNSGYEYIELSTFDKQDYEAIPCSSSDNNVENEDCV